MTRTRISRPRHFYLRGRDTFIFAQAFCSVYVQKFLEGTISRQGLYRDCTGHGTMGVNTDTHVLHYETEHCRLKARPSTPTAPSTLVTVITRQRHTLGKLAQTRSMTTTTSMQSRCCPVPVPSFPKPMTNEQRFATTSTCVQVHIRPKIPISVFVYQREL